MKERMVIINRLILLILVVAISSYTLSGCSIAQMKSDNLEKNTTNNLSTRDSETVTFIFPGVENSASAQVLSQIEKNLTGYLNIKLNFKWIPVSTYDSSMQSRLASNDEFDVFMPSSGYISSLVRDDLLLDITSLFPKNAPTAYKLYKENEYKNYPYSVMVNDKIYAIPSLMPGSSRVCAMVREDIMKEYNIPNIKTLADYEIYLRTLKEKNNGITPMVWMDGTIESLVEVLGFGMINPFLFYKWDDKSFKLIPCEETEEFKLAINTVKNWFEKGYVDMTSSSTAYKKGILYSYLENWHNAFNDKYTKFPDVPLTPYPLNMDKPAERRPVTDKVLAFSKSSKHSDAAIKLVEWVHTKQENYDLFMHGIEGNNFVLANGRIEYSKDKPIFTGWSGCSAFMNLNFMRPLLGDTKSNKDLYKQIANVNTRENPISEFIPDLASIKTLVDARIKYFMSLEDALKTSSTAVFVEEFVNYQKKAGSAEITSVIQKQLNEWLTKKGK